MYMYLQCVYHPYRPYSTGLLPIAKLPSTNALGRTDRASITMRTLSDEQLAALAGPYFAPQGLYQHSKKLPFLGTLKCNTASLTAGQWTELVVEYTVGSSGLADGAWIKGTFKFYSDWALFQTSNPKANNYVSAEYVPGPLHEGQTPATVQSLAVRFDQKGHERPFQKAIIVDIVDGYINPGDRIVVRLGDRRYGARGTRVQTFVEDSFKMRWYIDPVGTSRFAPIQPDIEIPIIPGPTTQLKIKTPRVVKPNVKFPIHIHSEDAWGNATTAMEDVQLSVDLRRQGSSSSVWKIDIPLPDRGWATRSEEISLAAEGEYVIKAHFVKRPDALVVASVSELITVTNALPFSRPFFADLHVHSDDTVGTNSPTYNFSYARQIAGLDIVGYTANDFNITKSRWETTLSTIQAINDEGKFIVFPGTEWCGNSAAGGDHNVVFLDDPAHTDEDDHAPEFPFDRQGNVARSFEWNEDGPSELQPGAWPLDEVYATYNHAADKHLLIPHVGGRRANLAWHHPRLERLIEIGSAWGHFEWFLRDAIARGWKLGVSANSDEHRGRCGGGVPGTAVFGTKGGLTGVLCETLGWREAGQALRARRTFATTGERLVGLLSSADGTVLQGDEMTVGRGDKVSLRYALFGTEAGFSSVEAWDATGRIFHRDLQQEASKDIDASKVPRKIRVTWGGARLYDRYREAHWQGSIVIDGAEAVIHRLEPFGGVVNNPEDVVRQASDTHVVFDTRTSGDVDGVDIYLAPGSNPPSVINVTGTLGGYVKVGDALAGNPHKQQPQFALSAEKQEAEAIGGKTITVQGGAELFVSAEILFEVELPAHVEGTLELPNNGTDEAKVHRAVYCVGRGSRGAKVITSPIFIHER